MKTGFFSKIAVENLCKNTRLYIPRILAEAGLLGCFYILLTLALDSRLSEALGGSYLKIFMMMGTVIIGLLSFILILYINRFLMKQRKSEYGLYNVLGMEKRHIIRILFCESLYTSIISVIAGVIFGILFYKLSSLLICRLLRAEIVAGFYYLNFVTVIIPVMIFAVLDLLAFVISCVAIYRLKPVELLKAKQAGEKEPKIKWIMLILGVLCIGAGYYISLTTQSPLEALMLFFAAVLLVIVGTYFLFITGTTFVLKCLKKNKKYYYNKKHMPAVSGLLFRMKHNAVGLASIAILATGVLVMISTTVSLYSGADDTVNTHYPQHLYLSANLKNGNEVTSVPSDKLEEIVRESADANGLEIKSITGEKSLTVSYLMQNGRLLTKTEVSGGYDMENLTNVIYITEDTYSRLTGKRLSIDPQEIAFCRMITTSYHIGDTPTSLTIGGEKYHALEKAITEKIRSLPYGELQYNLDTKWEALHNILDMYGTFLFLGILLGFVCLFSTVLIIYYKQISEGYEDRERFQIMEKIGMEQHEVRKTIGSQIRLQMFLPLVTAAVHMVFVFPILLKLLNVLMLSNTMLFVLCTVITFAVFACVYTAVYFITSKIYYKIVH